MKLGTDTIQTTKAHANLDAFYGPYQATEDKSALDVACDSIPTRYRALGLTIGIINNLGKVVEYLWKTNDIEGYPEEKVMNDELTITIPSGMQEVSPNLDGKTFSLTYILSGKTILREGRLLLNGVVVKTFTPMVSSEGITETFSLPVEIGVYNYTIQVTDIFGLSVNSDVYTLRYGTITALFDMSLISNIFPKTDNNLQGKLFLVTVNTIDSSVYIPSRVQLGSVTLYTFTGTETYPFTKNIEINETIPEGETKAKLLYTYNGTILEIDDTYSFRVIDNDSASLEVDSSFSGYAGKSLVIPFKINSGNSTFSFNVTLRMTVDGLEYSYVYQNANGNLLINLNIQALPIPQEFVLGTETSISYNCTITAQEKTNSNINSFLNITIILNKVTVYDPYNKSVNQFLFNSNKNLLSLNTFDSTIDSTQPRTYFRNLDTIESKGTPTAFVADFYVNISKSGQNKSVIKIIDKNNNNVLAEIKEESVLIGNMTLDIYLENEFKHIGIVYNRVETSTITGNPVRYSAIYIDGKLVKNELLSSSVALSGPLKIIINPNVNDPENPEYAVFQLNSVNVYAYGLSDTLVSIADGRDILYTNYVSNLEEVPDESTVIKLKLLNINNLFLRNSSNPKSLNSLVPNKKLGKLVPIGTIGRKVESGEVNALLEMSVTNKKLPKINGQNLQKAVATFCYYELNKLDGTTENGVVEVHTLGTSTLAYSVPNFAFTFYKIQDKLLALDPKTLVSLIQEVTLTAKADYMDSSHLNNTPTCIFYNQITANEDIIPTPSYARQQEYSEGIRYLDAILGEPCIIEYTDNQLNISELSNLGSSSFNDSSLNYINLGSFMLNVDKSGKSLGLEFVEDDSYLSNNDINVCYSLEGKSNIDTATDDNITNPNAALFNYNTYVKNEIGMPDLAYNFTTTDWNNLTLKELDIIKSYIFDGTAFEFRSDLDPDKWYVFELSSGLDITTVFLKVNGNYQIPSSDDVIYVEYKDKNSGEYIGHKQYSSTTRNNLLTYLYPIARMWYFVARSTTAQFESDFSNYFDKNYVFLYYINLMNFGLVDNLGKNSMFDTWNGLIWYPRPYDLDSQCGLDNQGKDKTNTYEEILPTDTFNLGFYGKTDLNTTDGQGNDTTQDTIDGLNNKNYSSKSSILWLKVWNVFGNNNEIQRFYANLRKNGYSAEAIIQNAKLAVIDKLPANQYNIDFRNKYLGTSEDDQIKAFGDRWDRFRNWITKRFSFCDSYFNYTNLLNIATTVTNYDINVDTPQYITVVVDSNSVGRQLALSKVTLPSSIGVVNHIGICADTITEITNLNYVSTLFIDTEDKLGKLNNLLTIDLSGNKYVTNLSPLYDEFKYLHTINISDSTVSNIGDIPHTVQNFYADNVVFTNNPFVTYSEGRYYSKLNSSNNKLINLSLKGYTGALVLENLDLIESIDLEGANLQYLRLENLPNLTTLNITDCTFNGDVDIVDITKTTLDFSNSNFQGNSLNFSSSGTNVCNIKNLILQGVTNLDSIDLDALSLNLETLNIGSSDIRQITVQENLDNLTSFYCSPKIKHIGDTDILASDTSNSAFTLDMTHFTGLTYATFSNASLIKYITNLIYTGTGNSMFSGCNNLISITSSNLYITTTCLYMFLNCWYLTTIEDIQLSDGTDSGKAAVTSAEGAFAKTHNITLLNIQNILNTTSTITNYYATLAFKSNVNTINLLNFFGSNQPTNISYLMNVYHSAGSALGATVDNYVKNVLNMTSYSNASTLESVSGYIPKTVTNASVAFDGNLLLTSVPYDIFKEAYRLTNIALMFANCNIQGITFTESFLGPASLAVVADGDNYKTSTSTITGIPSSYVQDSKIKPVLTTANGLFGNNANLVYNVASVNIFKNHTALTNIGGIFCGCNNVYGDATEIFKYNLPSSETVFYLENAFNGTKVYLTGKLFNYAEGTPKAKVRVGGLFAKTPSLNDNDSHTINVEFLRELNLTDSSSVSAYNNYSANTSTASEKQGVFEGCMYLAGSWSNISFLLSEKDCRRMFASSYVYNIMDSSLQELELPNFSRGERMFMKANLATNLSYFDTITFGTTQNIQGMFCGATFNNNSFTINFKEGNQNLSYLFAASNIQYDISGLDLPSTTVTTVYMFARKYPTSFTSLVDTSYTENLIDTYYTMTKVSDYRETGGTASLSGASRVTGNVPIFGSGSKILDKLSYTGHMFDQSAIQGVEGGLFQYCPNIIDCRYMFAQCRQLESFITKTINGVSTTNIFTSNYYLLLDVSGMFRETALAGVLYLNLTSAPNIKRADCMFEYVCPSGKSGISFGDSIFNSYNTLLRSINCFMSRSHSSGVLPDISGIMANLQYANFAFAFCEATKANIFANSSTLRSMVGMLYNNNSLIEELLTEDQSRKNNVNISDKEFPSNMIKTGNFDITNVEITTNIDKTSLGTDSTWKNSIVNSKSSFTILAYQ